MAQFLWTSFLASVVLTIVANVALRVVPGLGDRVGRWLASLSQPRPSRTGSPSRTGPPPPDPGPADRRSPPTGPAGAAADPPPPTADPGPRVQVHVPWKAMLIGSVVLTVLLNLPRLL